MKDIIVKGAREHNLKNINVTLPRDKFIVITGLSGSGKSTLAFDTIYAEGQRRYIESLSAYARQFLGQMSKPDIDSIEGLSPAISIEQKTTSKNPRSTVGTVTEIYDYLRLLFARAGTAFCPTHGIKIESQSPQRIADIITNDIKGMITVLSPIIRQKKGTYEKLIEDLNKDGYTRARINKDIVKTDEKITLDRYKKHDIEAVIDRIDLDDESHDNHSRLVESIEGAVEKSDNGLVIILDKDNKEQLYSAKMACPKCSITFEELQPRMFSFNSPFGACGECHGLGYKLEFDPDLIIPDKSLSIIDGAVALYGKMDNSWRIQQMGAVAKKHGFDILSPISFMGEKQFHILMHGDPTPLKGRWSNGASMHMDEGWEGLIPQSERLFHQTESDYRKHELEKYMRVLPCPSCEGKRLKDLVLAVKIAGKSIIDITNLSIGDSLKFFNTIELGKKEMEISKQILKELIERLTFLDQVGLTYLNLSRSAGSLSGGEAQRIRLATQIGANLMGVLYVLDEPSIGLHQRDNEKLIKTLTHLRDLGNTLIVVEHDEETMMAADHLVDMGPGAGVHGGSIIAQGTPSDVMKVEESLTGQYLAGKKKINTPVSRRKLGKPIKIKNARQHNLKGIDVEIPTRTLNLITGVSGSGKSTLIYDILYKGLMKQIYGSKPIPGKHDSIEIPETMDKVIAIDQSPIGKTPRSNPATYTKLFDEIRKIFAETKEAKMRGYKGGRFSFNVKGGRCEACQGDGMIKIEMNFLPAVYVECEECKGKRYNHETLEVRFKGKNIAEVLEMSVEEAAGIFENVPTIRNKLVTLQRVGLEYIKLGQSSTTLSGGEAQRIKLTRELAKRGTGNTMYILDEPTTGLHFEDTKKLIKVLNDLTDKGNTVTVIEHNLDVVKCADWILDLGLEGGDGGGTIVCSGTPEDIAACKESHTGRFLKKMLNQK